MSQPIYGHGALPLEANITAARAFWYDRAGWEAGKAMVSQGITGNIYLNYAGHTIATRKGEALTLCTQGFNTMTTRRYLGAVLAEVGWCCVALGGRTIALKGAVRYWPTNTELKALVAAGEAVIVGDDQGTAIPHGGLLPQYELATDRMGGKVITDRTNGQDVYLQFEADLEALGDNPSQDTLAQYFNQ